MRKLTLSSVRRALLLLAAMLAVPFVASAMSYTVDIDDVSRVKVSFMMSDGSTVYAEGFTSGANVREIGDEAAIIFKAADDASVIKQVYTTFADGSGFDTPERATGYQVYVHPGMDGATVKVTTAAVEAVEATATVKVDNVANLLMFQNKDKENLTLTSGVNTITFNAATDNPFGFMIKTSIDKELISVKLNGADCAPVYSTLYNVTLADGDVLDIVTEATTGGNEEEERPDPNTMITELPEGGYPMMYYRESDSYYPGRSSLINRHNSGVAGEIVYYSNGDVYIKSPFSQLPYDAYLKGKNVDGIITVKLPQKIYEDVWGGYIEENWAYRLDFKLTGEDQGTYVLDPDKEQEIKLKVEGDGSVKLIAGDDEDFILAATDEEGKWQGFGEYNIVYLPFTDTAAEAPSDLETEKYAFPQGGYFVNVGVSGSDIYVQGISKNNPTMWIKGTLADGKATFASGQYAGVYSGWHTYFEATKGVSGDPKAENLTDALVMDYDAEAKTLKAAAEDGFIINAGKGSVYYVSSYIAPEFIYQALSADFKPAAPYDLEFEGGVGADSELSFKWPNTDTEGNLLDVSKLTYKLYVDGEPYTFSTDEYIDLEDDIDEVPYAYSDYDFWGTGLSRSVFLYFSGFNNLGVQSIYTDEDGTKYCSDIAYLYPTGISTATVAGKKVSSEAYYDMSGRRVAEPAKGGLYIKRTTFADGTVTSTKIMR